MDILHLSDLHFGNIKATFDAEALADALVSYVKKSTNNPIIVLSGDITFQGKPQGYQKANSFINRLMDKANIPRERILACPGNHDVVDNSFESFDNFIYGIRRGSDCAFSSNTSQIVELNDEGNGVVMLLLNSSFHLDYQFGLIDDEVFNTSLEQYKDKKKIVVLHHNLLNIDRYDTSTVRNAYGLIQYLEEQGVHYILHGHQHAEQSFVLGKNAMKVYSVRSGNFPDSGYINGMNHYCINLEKNAEIVKYLAFEYAGNKIELREIKSI